VVGDSDVARRRTLSTQELPHSPKRIMRTVILWLTFASLLLLPLLATTQEGSDPDEACKLFLRQVEDSRVTTTLLADSKSLDKLVLETDSSSGFRNGGDYIERELRSWKSGRSIEFERTMSCAEGYVAVSSLLPSDETEPSITYSPPLPWMPAPLEVGTTWSWSGRYITRVYGSEAKLPATATGRVVGWETLTFGSQILKALHLRVEIEVGKDDEKLTLGFDHWVQLDPFRVVMRKDSETDYGETTFALEGSREAAPPAAENKLIIIDVSKTGIEKW